MPLNSAASMDLLYEPLSRPTMIPDTGTWQNSIRTSLGDCQSPAKVRILCCGSWQHASSLWQHQSLPASIWLQSHNGQMLTRPVCIKRR